MAVNYIRQLVILQKNGDSYKELKITIGLSTQNTMVSATLNKMESWLSARHPLCKKVSGIIGTGIIVDKNYLLRLLE